MSVRVLVGTDEAITYCMRDGVTREQVRNTIYHWAKVGKVKNYGKTGRYQALWCLWEIEEALRDAIG